MKDEDLKSAPGEVLHIPTVLGAVVITYNLEGRYAAAAIFSRSVADIFLGKIKKWNDQRSLQTIRE
jgi:phosphate transport system substrate-binding protein